MTPPRRVTEIATGYCGSSRPTLAGDRVETNLCHLSGTSKRGTNEEQMGNRILKNTRES